MDFHASLMGAVINSLNLLGLRIANRTRGASKKMFEMEFSKEGIKKYITEAKQEVQELGGLQAFKNGEWLIKLMGKCFTNYYESANFEYFSNKYSTTNEKVISDKLTKVACKNASLLGGAVGATVSADELITLFTAAEGGLGLPANIAIAVTAVAAESVMLVRIQLQLVANLAKVYGITLDPNDPEDILTILAYAIGGSVADAAGKAGMKIGGRLTRNLVKGVVRKEVLKAIQDIGKKIGVKILQKTIIASAVPVVSIGIGLLWNYTSTKAVGKMATRHLLVRREEFLTYQGRGNSEKPNFSAEEVID